MEKQSEKLIPMMKIVSEELAKKINGELKAHDVTFSQMRIIRTLYTSEKSDYSLKELEKIQKTSQQTIAGIVCRLGQKGLITTFQDTEDKRVKRVRLSEKGKQLAKEANDRIEKTEKEIEETITSEEMETILRVLKKVYTNVQSTPAR